MGDIYDWLYRNYACPAMAETSSEHLEILNNLVDILPQEKRLNAYDLITYIRAQWGQECFMLGVQLGLELLSAPERDADGYKTLLNFLSQLDQPVA